MEDRKKGTVKGFLTCNSEYLKMISDDLGLGADLPLMCYIQQIFKDEKREPNVSELYFVNSALKKSCTLRDAVLLSDLRCDSEDCLKLWNELSAEANIYAERKNAGLAFTSLAEYAATGDADTDDYSFSISKSEKPQFNSVICNRMIYWQSPSYRLSFSPEPVRSPASGNDCGVIISKPDGMSDFKYTSITERLLCDFYEYDRSASAASCSDAGLLNDIVQAFGPCCILLNELPGNHVNPEDLLDDYSGSVLVRTTKLKSEHLCRMAKTEGLLAGIPVSVAPDDNIIRIFSSYEPLSFSPALLEKMRLYRRVRVTAVSDGFIGKQSQIKKQELESPADCDIEAYEMDNDLFPALSSLVSPTGQYCLAGTVNPDSADTVPFILSIYAFRKQNRALDYAKFYIGKENSAVLFRIGATGTVFRLLHPKVTEVKVCEDKTENNTVKSKAAIAENLEQLVGNTPMLHIHQDLGANVYAKLEMFNPAGSAKDRPAIEMLNQAEASGQLIRGGTVIEATSGNTGIGLACYGTVRGYKVKIIMPDTMSKERIDLIRAYGAEVILTPGSEGMKGSSALAEKLHAEIPGSIIAGQFSNHANPDAHTKTTGPEIWRDLDGKIDVLVAGVGTGGTLCGTAAYLKKMNPSIRVIAVEPESSPLISRGISGPHKIQGIGANFIPDNFDSSLVDGVITVSNEDAINETVALARRYGLLCGISSGCASFAAGLIASLPANAGKTIVTVFPDTGEHYLSTGIFN